jgi:hypothetical protein
MTTEMDRTYVSQYSMGRLNSKKSPPNFLYPKEAEQNSLVKKTFISPKSKKIASGYESEYSVSNLIRNKNLDFLSPKKINSSIRSKNRSSSRRS